MEFEKLEVEKSEETIEPKKPLIKLENLTKEYNGKLVLKGINLTIYENEFVTLLGPSGCGKTTTLRLIGGFEVPSQGSVWFKDKNMTNIPSYQRPTNTVFQRYALFPHLNVYENVAFGLRILYKKNLKIKNKIHELIYNIIKEDSFFSEEKLNDYQISLKQKKMTALDAKVIEEIKKIDLETYLNGKIKSHLKDSELTENLTFSEYFNKKININYRKAINKYVDYQVKKQLKLVNLEEFEKRGINNLSGGQQQRVAIARALINEPQVLLLDEPLAALDLKLRQEMQYELKELQRRTGITFIFVTHDQEEALTMSDKVVIMNEGEIQQIGTPQDVYNEPLNRFVAKFIGESNLIEGTFVEDSNVIIDDKKFKCLDTEFEPNQKVDVVIRPEDIEIVYPSKGKFIGLVDSVVFKGVYYETNVLTDKREFTIQTTKYYPVGRQVGLNFTPEDIHLMEKM